MTTLYVITLPHISSCLSTLFFLSFQDQFQVCHRPPAHALSLRDLPRPADGHDRLDLLDRRHCFWKVSEIAPGPLVLRPLSGSKARTWLPSSPECFVSVKIPPSSMVRWAQTQTYAWWRKSGKIDCSSEMDLLLPPPVLTRLTYKNSFKVASCLSAFGTSSTLLFWRCSCTFKVATRGKNVSMGKMRRWNKNKSKKAPPALWKQSELATVPHTLDCATRQRTAFSLCVSFPQRSEEDLRSFFKSPPGWQPLSWTTPTASWLTRTLTEPCEEGGTCTAS